MKKILFIIIGDEEALELYGLVTHIFENVCALCATTIYNVLSHSHSRFGMTITREEKI